jgi:hypothetical protein
MEDFTINRNFGEWLLSLPGRKDTVKERRERKEVNRTARKRYQRKWEDNCRSCFDPRTREISIAGKRIPKARFEKFEPEYQKSLRDMPRVFAAWLKRLDANYAEKLSELGRLSFFAKNTTYLKRAKAEKSSLFELHKKNGEELVCGLYKLLQNMGEWITVLQSKISILRQNLKKNIVIVIRSIQGNAPRARARRSPARSAAKSGGDGGSGEDGDSDQGEPPGPLNTWTVDILHRLLLDGRCVR